MQCVCVCFTASLGSGDSGVKKKVQNSCLCGVYIPLEETVIWAVVSKWYFALIKQYSVAYRPHWDYNIPEDQKLFCFVHISHNN